MARPYNHPDNLADNGQPKMSEDAWALSEAQRLSDFLDLNGDLELRDANAVESLAKAVISLTRRLEKLEPNQAAALLKESAPYKDGNLAALLKESAPSKDGNLAEMLADASIAYEPSSPLPWGGESVKTVSQALDRLAKSVADHEKGHPYEPDNVLHWPTDKPDNLSEATDTLAAEVAKLKLEELTSADWAGTAPTTLRDAINRLSAEVVALKGSAIS